MTHDTPISDALSNKRTKQSPGSETSPGTVSETGSGVFVGIDVAKETLAVHICSAKEGFSKEDLELSNQKADFAKLAKRLLALAPERVVIEATGGYQTPLLVYLLKKGLPVSLVNPGQVRHFAKGHGQLAKTDKIDARILALFAEHVNPPIALLPHEEQTELSALIRRREQIMEMLLAERSRLPLAHRAIKPNIKRNIEWFKKQLKAVNKDLDRTFKESSIYKKATLLESIPGIARVSSLSIIAELPELGSLTNKQVASLAGVAPFARSSGKWRGKQSIRQGRALLRHKLYMAALNAVHYNPVIRDFFQRLRDKGKPFKIAIVATMRKLLCICNSIIRHQQPWHSNLT